MEDLTITNAAKVTVYREGSLLRIRILKCWTDIVRQADCQETFEILMMDDPEVEILGIPVTEIKGGSDEVEDPVA